MEQPRASDTNADLLGAAVARSRRAIAAFVDEADRARHDLAIDDLEGYVNLLRQATPDVARYPLKLEYPDGSWDVGESDLAGKPGAGELLSIGRSLWRVRGSQLVHPAVAGKAVREYIVCAPA